MSLDFSDSVTNTVNDYNVVELKMPLVDDEMSTRKQHSAAPRIDDVELDSTAVGLYIPADEILRRTAFQWFARLSAKQALDSDTMIGKYLLISR